MKKIAAVLTVFSLLIFPVCAEFGETDTIIFDTAEFLADTVKKPQISSIGGEWTVIGLFGSGFPVSKDYFDNYYKNVENTVKEKGGILSNRKYTEYSRVVTSLTLIGKNPEDVAGYNLVKPLYDFDKVVIQGLNGAIWALIALDSGNYADGEIRSKYVEKILESELETGGWSLSQNEKTADCDVTAMALTALAGHLSEDGVSEAVSRALDCILKMQDADGGFSTYGEQTAESNAQVITALSALGIDVKKFSKNGKTPLDALVGYYKKGEGFSHTKDGETNIMATEQALYALSSLKRGRIFLSGRRFSDTDDVAVLELAQKGIINGISSRLFAPEKAVTRAEFAVILVKSLGFSEDAKSEFSDVLEDDWFYPYVSAAYKNGIIFGVSETEFNPFGEITCEEAASMLQRAAESLEIKAQYADFDELEISDWAKDAFAFCIGTEIMEIGISPKKVLSREETSHMVYNMLKKAEIL